MTTVSGVSSATSTTETTTSAAQEQLTVDYEAFLQMMLDQLQNQDPTDPVDSSEQLAQLATFSQLEQSIQTNSKLETMLVNMSFGQVDDLVGRTATDSNGTTGTVTSVEVYDDGTLLGLDTGEGILLGGGVTIS